MRIVPALLACLAVGMPACGGSQPTPAQAVDLSESPAPAEPPAPEPGETWDQLAAEIIETLYAIDPPGAVYDGKHERDGQLPDWSPEGLARAVELIEALRARVEATPPDALDEARRFERAHALAVLEAQLFWRVRAEEPLRNPSFYGWKLSPSVYVTREYAPLERRARALITWAGNVPRALAQMRANLRTPMPKTFAALGVSMTGGMASYLESDVPAIFASVSTPELEQALTTAAAAFAETAAWFRAQQKTATDDFALGEELYAEMLRTAERVDVPLDRLVEIGRADLERNLAALKEACARVTPRKPIRGCIAKVQADKPEGGAVAGAQAQLAGLKEHLIAEKLVTIPSDETARVAEAPPYNRDNFAYIEIPGPFEKELPATYYIAPPDPSWSKKEQRDYVPGEADLLFTSVHEVWPGHFLHYLHVNRAERMFARLFTSYAFSEGWAHYTEEMMWESGLTDGDPQAHVGMLLNALLRNVRFLSAIGLHTGGMTVAASEQMFRDKAYQDAGNARQQAARGTYDPGYLNYTLGKLMIRKMRQDWTAERGGREAWGAFHDALLSYGGPPLPLVRAHLLGAAAGSPL